MSRTTITLPDALLRKAKKAAAERDISMAELIRQTLEERLASEVPKPRLGIFASESGDLSRLASEARVPPYRTYDHIMGRGEWAVDKDKRRTKRTKADL